MLSVSLGSSTRDFEVTLSLGSHRFCVRRIGTDGSIAKAMEVVTRYDGSVDAIGLGGVNMFYTVGNVKYPCADGLGIAACATKTPVVDGAGLKSTFERQVPSSLRSWGMALKGKRVLVVSVLDRWGLAEGFQLEGARVLVGDALFALGLPILFPGLASFRLAARLTMGVLCKIPVRRLYPLGEMQLDNTPRYSWAFRMADIIAGDFHFIKRFMPVDIGRRWVVTTTTSQADRDMLAKRGAGGIVTMTPPFGGRTFGANILDAMAVALRGSWPLGDEEYLTAWKSMGLSPHIQRY